MTGNTAVSPGVAPAKTMMGANSPMARAQVMIQPAIKPVLASGNATDQKARNGPQPRDRATISKRGLIWSNVAFSARMQNAEATKNWATMMPRHVYTTPNRLSRPFPTAVWLKNTSRLMPAIKGGMTIGRSMTVSMVRAKGMR